MGLFSIFRSLFGTPASFTTGEKFEHYARKYLFTREYYELLQKTHSYKTSNKNFVPSSDPDFKFRDRRTGRIFYVEAKYRKIFFRGQVKWCTEKQLGDYQERNRENPVFILLAVGGSPARPPFVSLIPLNRANFIVLYDYYAKKYAVSPGKYISSKILWRR
jgi:hypothetical protein